MIRTFGISPDPTRARARRRAALILTHAVMSAITQASAQVAKTVAVTTGKVANAKSMMIWRPHGNKYVNARDRSNLRVSFARGYRRIARTLRDLCERAHASATPRGRYFVEDSSSSTF